MTEQQKDAILRYFYIRFYFAADLHLEEALLQIYLRELEMYFSKKMIWNSAPGFFMGCQGVYFFLSSRSIRDLMIAPRACGLLPLARIYTRCVIRILPFVPVFLSFFPPVTPFFLLAPAPALAMAIGVAARFPVVAGQNNRQWCRRKWL